MNTDTAPILYSLDAGIARIRFNRPKALNALDVPMAQGLLDAVRRAQANGARVIVLAGEGRAFMAGGDLQTFHADLANAGATAKALIDPLHAALTLLAHGDAPVLASLHGAVAGAGMSVALGADLAIASADTVFNLAYARIGASVDGGGTWALARAVGLKRAMEIALLSDPIDAPAAAQLGLVNRVVPSGELAAQTDALAQRLADGPTLAYGRIRRLLRSSFERDFADTLDAERDAFVEGTRTRDFAEGIGAFFAKRAARFTGS
jgi:2-(1,2-epoxy-1,2-dihydrophenyl)acetyl-CoA isomerase